MNRTFVWIKKEKNTPKKYPRKAGLPSKEPLDKRVVCMRDSFTDKERNGR